MCSTTSEYKRSAELNTFQVSNGISSPSVVRPRGRVTCTWRPLSTTEPFVVPCQLPTRVVAGILTCFFPIRSVSESVSASPVDERQGLALLPSVTLQRVRPSTEEPYSTVRH